MQIGKRIWAIPEGYIPSGGESGDRRFISHEAACILNCSDQVATVKLTIYFADREPLGPYEVKVPARRTLHLRFNDLKDPEVPRETDYSSVFVSDIPVVLQHTRLDSRRSDIALMSTVGFSQ